MRTIRATPVTEPVAELGEGPVWDARGGELWWVDIPAGRVYGGPPSAAATLRAELGRPVGSLVPRAAGGWVAARADGPVALDADGTPGVLLAVPQGHGPRARLNDSVCDPRGRLWFGTLALDQRPGGGALHRLDPDGSCTRVRSGMTIPNGMGWSPDGRACYLVDTPTGEIAVHPFDPGTGELADAAGHIAVRHPRPRPDGLAVDAEGAVWVALWGGAAVHRYAPDRRLDTVVELPVTNVTSCAFGGPDLRQLFVTTARPAATAPSEPLAGAVFSVPAGVPGTPAVPYAG